MPASKLGGSTGRATLGRSTQATHPKTGASLWKAGVEIPWRAAFPLAAQPGYGPDLGDPAAGVKRPAAEGGWLRDETPSIVLVFDSSNAAHEKAIRLLEIDSRLLAASHLFNCFRVDLRGCEKPLLHPSFSVHATAGDEIGTVPAESLQGVIRLLETAYLGHTGRRLQQDLPSVQTVVAGLAFCDRSLESMEQQRVCVECGAQHASVAESIETFTQSRRAYAETLARFRAGRTKLVARGG